MDDVGVLSPTQEAPLMPDSGSTTSNSQQIATGPSQPSDLLERHGQKGPKNRSVDYLWKPCAFSLSFLTRVSLSMKEASQKVKNETMWFFFSERFYLFT